MSKPSLAEMFGVADGEFLKFDRIPVEQRRHRRPDICAMIYLDEKYSGDKHNRDMVACAEHDEIWLEVNPSEVDLTQDDVIYLSRCGVRFCGDTETFAMFV